MNRFITKALICCAIIMIVASTACSARTPVPSDRDPSIAEASPESPSRIENQAPAKAMDTSFETVTGHIDLSVSTKLSVTRPAGDIEIYAENYYITGGSDPNSPLYMNGEEVVNRGISGSFGVFAELLEGENVFELTQGEESAVVTITRLEEAQFGVSQSLARMRPTADVVMRSGTALTLSCEAPAGSKVTAVVNGESVDLTQKVATAMEGIAAVYTAEYTVPDVSGTESLGTVSYTLDWQDEIKEYVSAGRLFALGKDAALTVRGKDTTAAVFMEESDESGFWGVIKRDTIDTVTEFGASMYKLGMGGWVFMDYVEPLTDAQVPDFSGEGTAFYEENGRELLTLKGLKGVPYRVQNDGDTVTVTLYHSGGLGIPDIKKSALFSSINAEEAGGNTVFTLDLAEHGSLGGWLMDYRDSDAVLTFLPKPKPAMAEQPLYGIKVLLDPGHGGSDAGASGIPLNSGPKEKDINWATALALKAYLEGRGADVVLTRAGDEVVDLNTRLELTQQPDIDFMISLHCNSIPYNYDGTGPSGIEIYYFTEESKLTAESVLEELCKSTGRNNRGVRNDYYRVTLSSNAPSIMIEMGFLTNPAEYDALCDKHVIYDTVAAISAGIEKAIAQKPPETDEEPAVEPVG